MLDEKEYNLQNPPDNFLSDREQEELEKLEELQAFIKELKLSLCTDVLDAEVQAMINIILDGDYDNYAD